MCVNLAYSPRCPICEDDDMEELIDLHGDKFYECPACGVILSEADIIRADEASADILNIQDETREYVWDNPDITGYANGDYQE